MLLFPRATATPAPESSSLPGYRRSIEDDNFPFEYLSDIAELESWRKEIYRPAHHIHKWWAQRLGSVFRAIVLGTLAPTGTDILDLFCQVVRFPGVVVLDPFMGSGTTIGEAMKVGARAVGFDINPVAYFLVRNAIRLPKRDALISCFQAIERDVAPQIQRWYQTELPDGRKATVLYYFWVKQLPCPRCASPVDLFSSYVFVEHAYRKRHPTARVLCPECGEVNIARFDAQRVRCRACQQSFDPHTGPAQGQKATCRCGEEFHIAKVARAQGEPPKHRLYAKVVVKANGDKDYLRATPYDVSLYKRAERQLKEREHAYPNVKIAPGHNTNQVLNYSYTRWDEMFNARQLLCLSRLADRIREISDEPLREAFCCLFSGALEFNNMFTSFKGEGTGAVRHMFYHHILKPERVPLEANVWGTPRSSGAFSTMFQTRLMRAVDYCEEPFELWADRRNGRRLTGKKVYGLSSSLSASTATSFAEFETGKQVYLACRDSATTDLPTASVDAIITDPPFFDNVHYSELADFFYVWQRHILGDQGIRAPETTRHDQEVQQGDAGLFTDRLAGVWGECYRVLKPQGLLVFTYHHSRAEGWRSVLASLAQSGFVVVQVHPIKSEMSVATPKHQAKEPIDLDMIVVCRRRMDITESEYANEPNDALTGAQPIARTQLRRLLGVGRTVSRSDVRVVLMAHVVARLSRLPTREAAVAAFEAVAQSADDATERLYLELQAVPSVGGTPRQ